MFQRRSEIISTYAICGFANIGSIGVQLGTFATLIPSRMDRISTFIFRAMLAGTMASYLTACTAGQGMIIFMFRNVDFGKQIYSLLMQHPVYMYLWQTYVFFQVYCMTKT